MSHLAALAEAHLVLTLVAVVAVLVAIVALIAAAMARSLGFDERDADDPECMKRPRRGSRDW